LKSQSPRAFMFQLNEKEKKGKDMKYRNYRN